MPSLVGSEMCIRDSSCHCETVLILIDRCQGLLAAQPANGVYPPPIGQRHSSCVRACAQTTATVAPDCNTSSSNSVRSRRWSRVLSLQRVNPALAVAVGRMFHTAAVTQKIPLCQEMRYSSCRYNERQLIDVTVVRRVRTLAERWCDCEGHRRWK